MAEGGREVNTKEEPVISCYKVQLLKKANNQWYTQGTGDMKILYDNTTDQHKLFMKRTEDKVICYNDKITLDLKLENYEEGAGNGLQWIVKKDNTQPEQFAVLFRKKENMKEFLKITAECQTSLKMKSEPQKDCTNKMYSKEEMILFCHRGKLLKIINDKWQEQGVGEMNVLYNFRTGNCRLFMEREQSKSTCYSREITLDLKLEDYKKETEDYKKVTGLQWVVRKDNTEPETFAILFSQTDKIKSFKNIITDCQQLKIKPKEEICQKGYPKKIFSDEDIDDELLCSSCKLVLRVPYRSFCQHQFCKSCLNEMRTNRRDATIVCESCEKEKNSIEYHNLKSAFLDQAIIKKLSGMTANCPNEGCDWKDSFDIFIEHEKNCDFQLQTCECGEKVMKRHNTIHKKRDCPNRSILCRHCNNNFLGKDIVVHNENCPFIPIKCEGCEREDIRRKDLNTHQNITCGDCEGRKKICPLRCGNIVEGDLEAHVSNTPTEHIVCSIEAILQMTTQIHVLNDLCSVLSTELNCCQETMDSNYQEIEQLKKKSEEQKEKLKAQESIINALNFQFFDIQDKLQEMEGSTSCNGTFLWKVSNFRKKHEEAKSRKVEAIYSESFYTSKGGYKMCLKLYPNGDRMSRNMCLTLQLVIKEGKYDDVLPWPFSQLVTLQCLHRNELEKITRTFVPSIDRPTNNTNKESNFFPNFIDMSQINEIPGFIQNDTIYLKCIVDTTNL